MEIFGSLFLSLALAILVGIFVGRPFFQRSHRKPRVANTERRSNELREQEISALLAERDRILRSLQELDFDNVLGKIPASDYPDQREALLKRGVETLRRLDGLQGRGQGLKIPATPVMEEETLEDRIEASIAASRADSGYVGLGEPTSSREQGVRGITSASRNGADGEDSEIETMLANRRRTRKGKAGGFCPQCGASILQSDRFCSRCGSVITG